MLHLDQIRRQMHEITGLNVEKRAVMELLEYLETTIINLIQLSQVEHQNTNASRKIQGLPEKKRLDRDSVRKAIILIKSSQHSELSEKTGGTLSEKGEEHDKRKPETKDSGVEII